MDDVVARARSWQPGSFVFDQATWQRPLSISLKIGDLLVVAVAGLVTHYVRFEGVTPTEVHLLALLLGVVFASQCLAIAGSYDIRHIDRLTSQLPQALFGWTAAIVCTVVVLYLIKQAEPLSRLWLGSWFVVALVGLAGLRCAGKYWIVWARQNGALMRRLVIVREPEASLERILEGLDMDPSLDPIADFVVDFERDDAADQLVKEIVALPNVEQVLLVSNARQTSALSRIAQGLRHLPIELNLVAAPLAADLPMVGMRPVGSLPATVLLARPMEGPSSLVKEVVDRVAAASLIVLILPLLGVIALAVKLDSKGPVLFRQARMGFNRQVIEVLKFRTMYQDRCDGPQARTVVQASRNDDRVTRVGRFLRRSSLDELPQLFNVLRGEMALVGPRPHAIAHDEHYATLIDGYLGRHRVKPGITGWAQVNGCRGETKSPEDMRRRVELDLYYIENWSLGLDLKIWLRTPLVGFVHQNAY